MAGVRELPGQGWHPPGPWPERCANCGAGPDAIYWDPADGFGCFHCHATDADETG